MKALLLAAGKGRRFKETLNKCMIRINGKTLYERLIESLKIAGINKIVVVTGYNADILESLIVEQSDGVEIEFVRNDEYETTNNIWSFYLAVDSIKNDDLIILESDLIYPIELISNLIRLNSDNVAVVAAMDTWMNGTAVQMQGNFVTKLLGKTECAQGDIHNLYKTVNIYKLSQDFLDNSFILALSDHVMRNGKNDYYELVFKSLIQANMRFLYGYVLDEPWYEIDTESDFTEAEKIFRGEMI